MSEVINKSWKADGRMLALAQAVCKRKAYIKTQDVSFKDKYEKVISDLEASDVDFTGITLSFPSLQNTFQRHSAFVLKLLGISSEGANLSGLDSTPSEYHTLIMNMAEEVDARATQVKEAKVAKAKKDKNLLTHERTGLLRQSNVRPSASHSDGTTSPSDASEDGDGNGDRPTPASTGRLVSRNGLASTNDSMAKMQAALANHSHKRPRTEDDQVLKQLVQANAQTAEVLQVLTASVSTLTAMMAQQQGAGIFSSGSSS